jgi:homoserine O-acetyltransferase/O-succinyltransferase
MLALLLAALAVTEGDFVVRDFRFASGETLPELRLHYRTLGRPGSPAVLVLHGTTGSGAQFLGETFAGELFGPGQLLDAAKHFIILPDGIGHGGSSKPSDGLHARFPRYRYADMVEAQRRLLVEKLGVTHLVLIAGTSMGCMHSWMWAEAQPKFMNAVLALACLPVQIAGRNRVLRELAVESIRSDPAWNGGEYETAPVAGLRGALEVRFSGNRAYELSIFTQRVERAGQPSADDRGRVLLVWERDPDGWKIRYALVNTSLPDSPLH